MGGALMGQDTDATSERGKTLPEGGIKPFDGGRDEGHITEPEVGFL